MVTSKKTRKPRTTASILKEIKALEDMDAAIVRNAIKRFGGCSAVARACGVHKTTAFKWQSGKHAMPDSVFFMLTEKTNPGPETASEA